MSDTGTSTGRFHCDACGKGYRWKPELAGKKVKCKCGHVMFCPIAESRDEAEDALYDLAPEPAPQSVPSAQPALSVAAVPAMVHSPANVRPAPSATISYQRADVSRDAVDDYFPDRVKDLYAPLILIGVSTLIEVVAALISGARIGSRSTAVSGVASFPMAVMVVGVGMIVSTVIMMIGILIAAKARGISFGPFWTAVLKLAAVAIAPDALVTLLRPVLSLIPLLGGLIGWVLGFILYFALLGVFFDLDQSDTWYCVCVIFLVKLVLFFVVLFGVLSFLR
jgi:hypothetical protein